LPKALAKMVSKASATTKTQSMIHGPITVSSYFRHMPKVLNKDFY
jgi:hypothetical protein